MRVLPCCLLAVAFCIDSGWSTAVAQSPNATRAELIRSLHFHAPFDGSADARKSSGSGKILTASSLKRDKITPGMHRPAVSIVSNAGKYGDCLRFTDKAGEVLCFAGDEMHYSKQNWSGSVSLWLRLNPDQDLKPGYCDPLQITQNAWNDSAFFVDFDKDLPRDFRLGVFSKLSFWNPDNIAWEQWPVEKRPMVTLKSPPFSRSEWTHVAFTFENINPTEDQSSRATLYVNGVSRGTLSQPMKFSWDLDKTAIMLGIDYIGDLDDLMIFRRALTADEIAFLYHSSESL